MASSSPGSQPTWAIRTRRESTSSSRTTRARISPFTRTSPLSRTSPLPRTSPRLRAALVDYELGAKMDNELEPKKDYDVLVIGSGIGGMESVSYTHLRAHETVLDLVCRLLLEK